MKRVFTKLVSVWAIIAFVSVPAMGQSGKTAAGFQEKEYAPAAVQLRASGEWWPDSMIQYTAAGVNSQKYKYNETDRSRTTYTWENNQWIAGNYRGSYSGAQSEISSPEIWWDENGQQLNFFLPGGVFFLYNFAFTNYYPTYNASKKLTSLVIKDNNSKDFMTFSITYNDKGNPVQVTEKNYQNDYWKADYQYNADGNLTRFESTWGIFWSFPKIVCKYDSQGRIKSRERWFATEDSNQYSLDAYWIYYYSEGHTHVVDLGNLPLIGDTNKGSFDVTVNVPADSIAGGSFVVQLPDGFTLDKNSTKLTLDFNGFDLVITKQADNSWLLELKPKSMRNATLLAGEAGKTLAHIACTVGGNMKRGTYDITVSSILFETPGGDALVEPAITVPVTLNRWGTGNESVDTETSACVRDGVLYIQSIRTQPVTVYAISGVKLYEGVASAGTTTLDVFRYPRGVYIVVFGDGTKWKVIN
ncbi:hypothetical protein FACS189416_7220 [Bacteroidia bacterium]|nr:hypothetical protein FACS189416_7220 [Bacteroidia bacterium]